MTQDSTLSTARTLPFSPEQIYTAFANANLLSQWWGPEGFSNTFETFEFKEGGDWIFVMHGPDGKNYKNKSFFKSLVPNSKIVIRHDCPPFFTLTVQLTPAGDGTHVTWDQEFADASTAQAVASVVGTANEQNLDRLTAVLDG